MNPGKRGHDSFRAMAMGAGVLAAAAALAFAAEVPSTPSAKAPPRIPGMITRAQLDKIPLASVMDPPAVEGALVFPNAQTAAWLEAKEYREGEPVMAWLAVKSLARESERGIPANFDLGLPGEKVRVAGTARLQLAREKAGAPEEILAEAKGDTALAAKRILLPPGGFTVNCGDVRNLTGGKLAPGSYILRFWAEGQRAEARFTISNTGPAPAIPAAATQALAHEAVVLHWIGSWDGGRRPRRARGAAAAPAPGKWVLTGGYLAVRTVDDFAKGLTLGVGAGPDARYFSRLDDLKDRDDVVAVSAKIVPGTLDHIEITLSPANAPAATQAATQTAASSTLPSPAIPGEAQWLPNPQVYLLVENLGPPSHQEPMSERQRVAAAGRTPFNSPILMDLELPDSWNQRVNYTKKARITVIISSDPVCFGVEQHNGDNDLGAWAANPQRETRWVGIVRSAPMEITLREQP